jgi:hypothetical protein
LGGGIDGREKASTMYCSDSAFAIYEFNNQEEVKMSDTNIKLELNAFEAGYIAGMLIKQMDERPEEEDFLKKYSTGWEMKAKFFGKKRMM